MVSAKRIDGTSSYLKLYRVEKGEVVNPSKAQQKLFNLFMNVQSNREVYSSMLERSGIGKDFAEEDPVNNVIRPMMNLVVEGETHLLSGSSSSAMIREVCGTPEYQIFKDYIADTYEANFAPKIISEEAFSRLEASGVDVSRSKVVPNFKGRVVSDDLLDHMSVINDEMGNRLEDPSGVPAPDSSEKLKGYSRQKGGRGEL